MRKMKDSGVEWIGTIPKKWDVTRIGSIYKERNTKVSEDDFPALSITKNGVVPQLETAAKTLNRNNRKLVRINDFVINSRSDRRGSCGISKYDGSCSLINIVLEPIQKISNMYFSFVFKSELFADEFYRWGNGIVDDLWSTRWQSMKKILVPFPSLTEQKRLGQYLKDKCLEIDHIIDQLRLIIEKLKDYKQSLITETVTKGLDPNVEMKDSGVDWIGKIPKHWNIKKIKYVAKLNPSVSHDLENDSIVTYTPMDFIKNGYFIPNSGIYSDIPQSLNVYENGDIVLAKVTPCFENGNIALMNNLDSGIGFGSSELFVLRAFGIEPKYLLYWLQNHYFKQLGISRMTGTGGLKRIPSDFVENCEIHYPPRQEQEEIVEYLEKKLHEINRFVDLKQQLIDKLEAYKKSLIYEVVTGKKEV